MVICHGSIPSVGEDVGELELSDITNEIQNGTSALENSLAVYCKLNINLPCNPGISLLDISPLEMKTHIHTKTFYVHCSFTHSS